MKVIVIILLTGISFVIYGISLFKSNKMQEEFIRFKLQGYIRIVGTLEILGGFGLIVGLQFNFILIISSMGLTLLMLLGVITRIRVKDSLLVSFPAIFFMIINFYILYLSMTN
tara:strand:- start:221 stop:559 length:339 start_codon:yes stop_codon:yes gene_type:complete